jgi:uncharacterized protein
VISAQSASSVHTEPCSDGKPGWGFFATFGWALLAIAAGMGTAAAISHAFGVDWISDGRGGYGNPSTSLTLMLGYASLIAVLALAAKLSGSCVTDYLGLVKPRGRYLLFGLLCLALPALFTFAFAMNFDVRQLFNTNGFQRSGSLGGLTIHFLLVAGAAPVMEELLFRGFLYRGLSSSRIGALGAVIVTAILWALMHGGRGTTGTIDLVVDGMALGWLRWYTGSTLATIACHVANNSFFSMLILIGLSGWLGQP